MPPAPRRSPILRPAAFAAAAVATLLAPACSREPRPAMPPPSPAVPIASTGSDRYVTSTVGLRREPIDQAKVRAEGARSQVPNQLALLHRGERVTLIDARGDWSRVRASDGTEGWLRSQVLLPADGVSEATVLVQAWAFDRPDLLAVNVKRKVDPGSLLLVVKTRELFSEVDAGQGPSAWILSDRITTRPEDVMASKLVEKARWLARSGRPDEAKEVLAVLRARLPDSVLLPVIAVELGEAPPPAAGPPDGGAPGGLAPEPPAAVPAPPPR